MVWEYKDENKKDLKIHIFSVSDTWNCNVIHNWLNDSINTYYSTLLYSDLLSW